MKKKLLAMLLAAVMIMAMLPTAFAADSDFEIVNGVLRRYNGSGGNVTIPAGVTRIDYGAFEYCTGLTSVTFPSGITGIDNAAFYGCTSLTSVTIPASVIGIGIYAFEFCSSLADVYYGGSEAQWNAIVVPSDYGVYVMGDGHTIVSGISHAKIHYNSTGPDTSAPTQPETPAITFTDVGEDSWCLNAVSWAAKNGIIIGYGDNTFDPDGKCTNEQILTILYRAAAKVGGAASNDDMDEAVSWAREHNMIGDGFERDANCTRADAVMFIWQVKGSPAPTNSSSFTDVPAGTAYADAVSWAVEKGVTNGYSASHFGPKDTCTRGQIVTFLYRALAD